MVLIWFDVYMAKGMQEEYYPWSFRALDLFQIVQIFLLTLVKNLKLSK